MTTPVIDLWFDFASTYTYPAAMRVEGLAATAGLRVAWRPFLLGPVFKSLGWENSPFTLQPIKGRYMLRDMERICQGMALPLQWPDPVPQRSLLPGRIALSLPDDGSRAAFSQAVFAAQFGQGASLEDAALMHRLLTDLGQPADEVMAQASSDAGKLRLRQATEEAIGLDIFGAPTFRTADGELFWGHDRLTEAVAWASARC